jgi:hypothetical protein
MVSEGTVTLSSLLSFGIQDGSHQMKTVIRQVVDEDLRKGVQDLTSYLVFGSHRSNVVVTERIDGANRRTRFTFLAGHGIQFYNFLSV